MKNRRNCVFGTISIIVLSLMNLVFTLPLFITMLSEQIRMGEGTMLEMGAIAIWILEVLLLFPLHGCIFFIVISIVRKDYVPKIIINLSLLTIYIVLNVLSNMWMFL